MQASGRAFAYQEQGPRLYLRTRKRGGGGEHQTETRSMRAAFPMRICGLKSVT